MNTTWTMLACTRILVLYSFLLCPAMVLSLHRACDGPTRSPEHVWEEYHPSSYNGHPSQIDSDQRDIQKAA